MKITVRDALTFGGLVGSVVVAGADGIDNVVESVTVLEVVKPDARQWNLPNQLHITAFYAIQDEVEAQIAVIRSLSEGGCSGIVLCHLGNIMKKIHPDVISVCDTLRFPLIVVPQDVTYVEILVPIVNRILQISNEKNRLALEIQEELLQKVIREEGLESIAQFLGIKIGAAIVIIDIMSSVVAHYGIDNEEVATITKALHDSPELTITNNTYIVFHLERDYYVYPIVVENDRYGYLICEKNTFDHDYVLLMLQHAAVACSLIVTHRHRKSTMRQIYKNSLIKELVEGTVRNTDELHRIADGVNWNLDVISCVLVLEIDGFDAVETEILRRLDQISGSLLKTIYYGVYDARILVFLTSNEDNRRTAELLLTSIDAYKRHVRSKNITMSVSGFIDGTEAIPHIYRVAVDALVLGKRLFPGERIHMTEQLGFLPYLYQHGLDAEHRRISEDLMEPLMSYDRKNNHELVKTLEMLLLYDQNAQRTADELCIHRNTLNYRKNKIIELLNCNPFTGFERLNYLFAVFVHKFA